VELHSEIPIDAPAADAWAVLGEAFGDIGTWASAIAASSLDGPLEAGAVRTCDLASFAFMRGGTIQEHLDRFEPDGMRFAYTATDGMPWFIRQATNRWSVTPDGPDRCIVRSHATVDLVGWFAPLQGLMRRQLSAGTAAFAEELRHRVEQGTPHPRKQGQG